MAHFWQRFAIPVFFGFSLHSGLVVPWLLMFYFIMTVSSLLNLRYPRDSIRFRDSGFWLFHFLWLFPWSVYFPAITKLSYKTGRPRGRVRLFGLCWTVFLIFFISRQPKNIPSLLPCARAAAGLAWPLREWIRRERAACESPESPPLHASRYCCRNSRRARYISDALSATPVSTHSLGHMLDLTFDPSRILRLPLLVAACVLGRSAGHISLAWPTRLPTTALMMVFVSMPLAWPLSYSIPT